MSGVVLTDAALVARCRTGDHNAWRDLVERYSRYVHAISVRAYRLTSSDAEDVFQDVFLQAYTHLSSLRDDAAFRGWLAKTTHRCCVDRLRRAKRVQPVADIEPTEVDDTFRDLDEALAVREALERLDEPYGEILDRFFTRDESYRTISEALDIPEGTIASRISRGLAKLRADLEERNPAREASMEG
jgi:RNA polymerase sigma factor (sigma-70 family)